MFGETIKLLLSNQYSLTRFMKNIVRQRTEPVVKMNNNSKLQNENIAQFVFSTRKSNNKIWNSGDGTVPRLLAFHSV